MAVVGACGFVAYPPMNIANATKAWTGHFIYAIYSAARRQHVPCSTRSCYGFTWTPPSSFTSLFSRYNREPIISRDNAFDRVRGLHRLAY